MHNKSGKSINPIWINGSRAQAFAEKIVFDEERKIKQYPSWEEVIQCINNIPYEEKKPVQEPHEDIITKEWQEWVLNAKMPESYSEEKVFNLKDIKSPCEGCAAYCCTSLVFPFPMPKTFSDIDYVKYALGFPGIQIGITDNEWCWVVKTTCRHLKDSKCSIYDKKERPLTCRYFPEQSCSYKKTIGKFRSPNYIRLGLDQYEWLQETIKFDKEGQVIGIPTAFTLRNYVEARWREREMKKREQYEVHA